MKWRNLNFIGKLHSYHFTVCLDWICVHNNSLKTSKRMEFWIASFDMSKGGNCGCLTMIFFWWYLLRVCLVVFFFFFQSWEASVGGRPHCQGFILASADPQPWTHCWNAGKILEPHSVHKVFKPWQWGAWTAHCSARGTGCKVFPVCRAGTLLSWWQGDLGNFRIALVLFSSDFCIGLNFDFQLGLSPQPSTALFLGLSWPTWPEQAGVRRDWSIAIES